MESASSTNTKTMTMTKSSKSKSTKGTYSITVTTGTLVATGHYPATVSISDKTKKLGQDYIPEYHIVLPDSNSDSNSDGNSSGTVCYMVNHVAYFLGYTMKNGKAHTVSMEFFKDCLDGSIDGTGLVARVEGNLEGIPSR